MPRPLRIEYAGALYHVMNHGNQHQDVFRSALDCETFLEKLEICSESYAVEVYSYCLMPNHFHLIIKTLEPNLSKFMQALLTSYTVTLNRRNGVTGHLFHGRYKSLLVETRKYLSVLSRYIHLNPVRIKTISDHPVIKRKKILTEFQWSSYRACVGLAEAPSFLKIDSILSTWGNDRKTQMKSYRAYVENGLYKGVDNPFDLAIRQQIIGSETFAEKIAREHLLARDIRDPYDQKEVLKARQIISPDEVINLTAKAFNTTPDKIVVRKGKHCQARKVAMHLCCKYCVSRYSLTKLAEKFSVTLGGLTKTRDILKKKMGNELKLKVEEIGKQMLPFSPPLSRQRVVSCDNHVFL